MPFLAILLAGSTGAWLGSLSNTAVSPSPIVPAQEASLNVASFSKAAFYATGAIAVFLLARKLVK